MQSLDTIHQYLERHSDEIGNRILASYPALYGADEAPSPLLSRMVRVPYPAQTLAIMGVSKRWQLARNANVVAECGAGKTLIALGSMLVHSAGRPFPGLVMAPPHLVEKWARETFLTLPQVRVFLVDDMRNGGDPTQPHGINEVRLRRGEIVREGLHTSLAELRRLGREGWRRALSWDHDLLHWPRESQALVFLEALLRQEPFRKIPRVAHKPRHRLSCRDGWGAAERSRLSRKSVCTRSWRTRRRERRNIPRSGRRTAARLLAWRRRNTWAATCRNGGTTPLRMKSTNWPATPLREMLSECSTKRQDGSWG